MQEREQKSARGNKRKLAAMLRAKRKEKMREKALELGAKQLEADKEKDAKKAERAQAAADELRIAEVEHCCNHVCP